MFPFYGWMKRNSHRQFIRGSLTEEGRVTSPDYKQQVLEGLDHRSPTLAAVGTTCGALQTLKPGTHPHKFRKNRSADKVASRWSETSPNSVCLDPPAGAVKRRILETFGLRLRMRRAGRNVVPPL